MFRGLSQRFEYLFRRRRLEDDLDEELRSSFEMIVERFVALGMAPEEARRRARLEFEGLEQIKENTRDNLAGSALQAFVQDARYAWRGLRRYPLSYGLALLLLPAAALAGCWRPAWRAAAANPAEAIREE